MSSQTLGPLSVHSWATGWVCFSLGPLLFSKTDNLAALSRSPARPPCARSTLRSSRLRPFADRARPETHPWGLSIKVSFTLESFPVTLFAVPVNSLLAPNPLDRSVSLLLLCPPGERCPTPTPGPGRVSASSGENALPVLPEGLLPPEASSLKGPPSSSAHLEGRPLGRRASCVVAMPRPQRSAVSLAEAFSRCQRKTPRSSLPSDLAGCHSGPGLGRGGSGINHARAGSSAPLLSSWPLVGPDVWAQAVPTAPLVFLACGPSGKASYTALLAGSESCCLCVVRVVTVTKPPATWPSVWPGWWLRHPWPGQGSLKCVEAAGGVGWAQMEGVPTA